MARFLTAGAEERAAWDLCCASALSNYVPGWVHDHPEEAADGAAKAADAALVERRHRFGEQE